LKKTALYFGSFNPVHIGHLAIANYITEFYEIDELWFVVSPQNPFKKKESLLDDYHRLEMVNLAVGDHTKFRASSIEFGLPQPSYTINTLEVLKEKYPSRVFSIIIGSDNLENLHKWKNYEALISEHEIIVYPRNNFIPTEEIIIGKINFVKAPIIEISSSFIRQSIKEKKDMRFFLPESVYKYLTDMHFYEK
jgi:nicotinate-nucleotide adenylyltransferase